MEAFASLLKQETLLPLQDMVIPGSLAFESLNPFPGYYSESPDSPPPVYLYLAVDKNYRMDEVLRAAQAAETRFEATFDVAKAVLTLGGEELPALRLRHFGAYGLVQPLQEAFIKQGIGCLKKTGRQKEVPALVRIIKMISLQKVDEGIYTDLKEDFHGYATIPEYLPWPQFERVTRQVKYNWFGSKFDAAIGSFYLDKRLHEFVRIYSTVLTARYMNDIRNLYLEKLSHPLE